jgi:hypothetical protein
MTVAPARTAYATASADPDVVPRPCASMNRTGMTCALRHNPTTRCLALLAARAIRPRSAGWPRSTPVSTTATRAHFGVGGDRRPLRPTVRSAVRAVRDSPSRNAPVAPGSSAGGRPTTGRRGLPRHAAGALPRRRRPSPPREPHHVAHHAARLSLRSARARGAARTTATPAARPAEGARASALGLRTVSSRARSIMPG